MKKNIVQGFLSKYSFVFITFGIVIMGFVLRFVNFKNRWGLASDQAQFAIVAKYALQTFQIPLLGPFSSGGPFQTGGEWYWLVMTGFLVFPSHEILGPWIFVSLLTLFAVGIMIVIGAVWENKKLGLILGVLLASSPAQIAQSSNLTNQTPIVLFSSLSLLFMILFVRLKRNSLFFLQVLMIGIGTSIHIQAVALIPLCILTGFFFSKKYLKLFILSFLGLFIPWIPVLIKDFQNNFYNTTNILTYFINPQSQVSYEVLGRRWLTFAGIFIPKSWGQIVGGNDLLGYFSIIAITGIGCLLLWRRNMSKELWTIYLSIAIMIIIMRYIHTPLFESFFIFLHPFVIFLTGHMIYTIFKLQKFSGIALLVLFVGMSILTSAKIISRSSNVTQFEVMKMKMHLMRNFENKPIALYDLEYEHTSKSLPLVLYLYNENIAVENGVKIGLGMGSKDTEFLSEYPVAYGEVGGYRLFNLSKTGNDRNSNKWFPISPKTIYDSVENWYKQ